MINTEFQKRILSSIILLPLSLYLIFAGSFYLILFTAFCFFISFYEWNKMVNKIELKFFGTLFLFFSFYTFYDISTSKYWIFVLLVCVSTDIGGYVFGKLFKGPKLTKISPKKTYSGMIGSFITSIFVIFLFFSQFYSDAELLLITVLLSLISQIGDLSISFIKRKSKLKNTGSILPGHGGLLDRLDGFIFAIPFSVFIFKII